jgi:hypothetical protein
MSASNRRDTMEVERVCKELGVIQTLSIYQALNLIEKESHWTRYAAADRLKSGMTLETPQARYVLK